MLVYGKSQVDSTVTYTRMKDEVSEETTAEAECRYPDYTVEGQFPDVFNDDIKNSNWQSRPHLAETDLEFNTIYSYKVSAEGVELVENPETGELEPGTEPAVSEEISTEEFLLYQVQASDILPRIAAHYGVDFMTILEDNHLPDELTVEHDVLFIREPKTAVPYTRDHLTDFDMHGRSRPNGSCKVGNYSTQGHCSNTRGNNRLSCSDGIHA